MSLNERVCFQREMSLEVRKLGSWRHDRDFTYPRTTNVGTGARLCVGQRAISFALADRHTAYDWMANTLEQFGYARCKRPDKGILRRYLRKVTGFSVRR